MGNLFVTSLRPNGFEVFLNCVRLHDEIVCMPEEILREGDITRSSLVGDHVVADQEHPSFGLALCHLCDCTETQSEKREPVFEY